MTIHQLLQQAIKNLVPISNTPALDAQLLLAHILKKDRSFLFAYPEQKLKNADIKQFYADLNRRMQREPIAYILGQQEFWSLSFKVTSDVLIPRPETEHIVEFALTHLAADQICHIADLGTGSGAIAIAIAHERPHWKIIATDISKSALLIAKENAKKHRVLSSITFQLTDSNWLATLPENTFDAILTNPPYINPEDSHLQTLTYEPAYALIAEGQGLADIETIIKNAMCKLKKKGFIAIEHGHQQAMIIAALMKQYDFYFIKHRTDLAGHSRFTVGYRKK